MFNTYSFQEAILTLSHPSKGKLTTNGLGLGSISIEYATDLTEHSIASDGRVMVSKKKDNSGSFRLEVQQTSDLHQNLIKWFNYLKEASASEWALATGIFKNVSTGEQKILTGVSMTKIPDGAYAAAAANVTWSFMVADIQTDVI